MIELVLYVAQRSAPSRRALSVLRRLIREERLELRLTVIDVFEQPEDAERNNILFTPTLLVRRSPGPARTLIVGDFERGQVVALIERLAPDAVHGAPPPR